MDRAGREKAIDSIKAFVAKQKPVEDKDIAHGINFVQNHIISEIFDFIRTSGRETIILFKDIEKKENESDKEYSDRCEHKGDMHYASNMLRYGHDENRIKDLLVKCANLFMTLGFEFKLIDWFPNIKNLRDSKIRIAIQIPVMSNSARDSIIRRMYSLRDGSMPDSVNFIRHHISDRIEEFLDSPKPNYVISFDIPEKYSAAETDEHYEDRVAEFVATRAEASREIRKSAKVKEYFRSYFRSYSDEISKYQFTIDLTNWFPTDTSSLISAKIVLN